MSTHRHYWTVSKIVQTLSKTFFRRYDEACETFDDYIQRLEIVAYRYGRNPEARYLCFSMVNFFVLFNLRTKFLRLRKIFEKVASIVFGLSYWLRHWQEDYYKLKRLTDTSPETTETKKSILINCLCSKYYHLLSSLHHLTWQLQKRMKKSLSYSKKIFVKSLAS